ncbi:MAG: efflux RND transporter periplasmic adaptor subunit [Planctomycetaceae bacterium]|nr:efflux RND transporter periplasmic adaptor subunit [Planctomycetaceae bacterium]
MTDSAPNSPPPEPHAWSRGVRRVIVSEVLIVLILAAAVGGFRAMYAQKPEVRERAVEKVRLNVDVFAADPVTFQELLTGFGTAEAEREVIVAAQVSGEITEIHPQLEIGYPVTAGRDEVSPDQPTRRRDADLLLKIDSRDFQERVEQAGHRIAEARTEIEQLKVQQSSVQRQLAKAKAVLATLNEEYERVREAVDRRVGTPTDLNRALLEVQRYEDTIIQLENQASAIPHQITAAQQRLSSGESERNRATNDLERTTVVPPFDGTLSEVCVEQGQFVRAGEPLVRLTDPERMVVPVALGLDNFLELQQVMTNGGQPAVALAENETATARWYGYLTRTAPEADQASRTVRAFIEVDNTAAEQPLLPGTFVHARIDGRILENALLIPRETVVNGFVFVVDDQNIVRRRHVHTGRTLQSLAVVTEGLEAGEQVVMTNLDIVEAGMEVVVQTKITARDEIDSIHSPVLRLMSDTKSSD